MSQEPETLPDHDARTREFLLLLGQHEPALRSYLFALAPQWADAQDLMQEVRLRLWDQFDEYDPARDFGAWSRAIAYYLALAHRERQTRRQSTYFSGKFFELVSREAAELAEEQTDREEALRACVQKLADHARRLLLRCYAGRESLHDIADSLGRSYEATRKSVFRIRQTLTRCVQEMLKDVAS